MCGLDLTHTHTHTHTQMECLGPGKYNTKDFIQEMNSKPSSSRGVCQSRDSRLDKENKVGRKQLWSLR